MKLRGIKVLKGLLVTGLALIFLVGCSSTEENQGISATNTPTTEENEQSDGGNADETASSSNELLIYCGVTMVRPMEEIAAIIEEQENCTITFETGGSGSLLSQIQTDKVGDLFLPGSDSYITTLEEEGSISDQVLVGYNKACILVQKGNPLNITANLDNLVNPEYYVVIGNPDSGSIGKETKKILENKGIFDEVVENASTLTNDSTELLRVIKEGETDLVINWYATSQWEENVDYVDVLEIDEEYASKKNLVIGLLEYSENKDIAQAFMDYASSEDGKEIFNKYGLYDVK